MVTVVALAGCGAPGESPPSLSPTPSAGVAAPGVSPDAPRTSARDLLECDGPTSQMGGHADDFGPDGGGSTPGDALESWLATNPFSVPKAGYEPAVKLADGVAYTYAVDGRVKVVVVISSRLSALVNAPYTIDELWSCAPAEYGADADLGPGRRIWTDEETGRILVDIAGPAHCDWESARLLHLEDAAGRLAKQYVRDPMGVIGGSGFVETYAEGVALPADATFSGYRTEDGLELWFTPADRAAFVVRPDGVVERWPRADPPIGCT